MVKKTVIVLLLIILCYTRFVGLNWGLPYPMHPDERNMAVAIQQLNCNVLHVTRYMLHDCFNPNFYAYGQFPLYLGRIIVWVMKFFDGDLATPVGFQEAVISLRFISAVSSIINVFIILKILQLLSASLNSKLKNPAFLLLTFSPYMIQFSHFGTTESLLMLFYSLIIYLSLKLLSDSKILNTKYLILVSLFSGLAIAVKASSIIFLVAPVIAIISNIKGQKLKLNIKLKKVFLTTSYYLLTTILISIIFSPHNLISYKDLIGAIRYESDVALGRYVVFYTRQFVNTVPVIFQLTKIFPYALGWPQFILSILGFFLLPWKQSQQVARILGIQTARRQFFQPDAGCRAQINFLRLAFIIYFLPNSFIFAKLTRFMAPILPILSVFAVLFFLNAWSNIYRWSMSKSKNKKSNIHIKNGKYLIFSLYILFFIFHILYVLPGFAHLSIYRTPDVRFQASKWVYENIPEDAYILSETANVVDIPIPTLNGKRQTSNIKNYNYVSFNFYDLDEQTQLQYQLRNHLSQADYIFVPSRRIFTNHTCQNFQFSIFNFQSINNKSCQYLQSKYPLLNKYYEDLFSGRLGFTQVAQFSSFPKICLFNVSCLTFDDEAADETWSVFDHPVIRIYKKNPNFKIQMSNQAQNPNFSNYQTTNYLLLATNYLLLFADSPEKWEKGLMFVKNKQDIGGADGMIFLFPDKKPRTFWNKNTLVDLNLYWLEDDNLVGKSLLPSIEKTREVVTVSSPKAVNKVIELIR